MLVQSGRPNGGSGSSWACRRVNYSTSAEIRSAGDGRQGLRLPDEGIADP